MATNILYVVYTFSFLIYGSQSESSTCSGSCNPDQQSPFKTGHTYVYNYAVESFVFVNITASDQQPNKVGLTLTAEVQLHVSSPCDIVMSIHNATMVDQVYDSMDVSERVQYNEVKEALSKNCLHIHYQQSKILGICHTEEEPQWVLNMKRGILSVLQYNWDNTGENYTIFETDIHGMCKSQYSTGEADGWKVVKRKRNLNECMFKGGVHTTIDNSLTGPFFYPLDLFRNKQVCKYVLGDMGQPVMITCKERHRFQPHASRSNLVIANITQHLDLDRVIIKQEDIAGLPEKVLRQESLFFEFPDNADTVVLNSFQEALETIYTNYIDEAPFIMNSINFMSLLRNASYQEITDTFKWIEKEYSGSQYAYADAIWRSRSPAGIQWFLEAYQAGRVKEHSMIAWFVLLPLIKEPTTDMLISLKPSLEIENHKTNIYLGISGLVNNFCKIVPDCLSEDIVLFYINFWDTRIQQGPSKIDHVELLLSLRAIGNIGFTNAVLKIEEIIKDINLSLDLRTAAVEALRKMPCAISTSSAQKVFMKMMDNSEFRIRAYLQAVKCPTMELLEKIVFKLQYEELNDVTTFVWDHLSKTEILPEIWRDNVTDLLNDDFFRAKFQSYIANPAEYYENYNNFTTFNGNYSLNGITMYQSGLPWSSSFKLAMSINGQDDDSIEFGQDIRDFDLIIQSLFPSKTAFPEEGKYFTKGHDEDNFIPVNEEYSPVMNIKKVSRAGNIYGRILNKDLLYANTLDLLSLLLNFTSDKKSILGHHDKYSEPIIKKFGVHYNFPTAVGFPLESIIIVSMSWKENITSSAAYKSNPTSKFNINFDFIPRGGLETSVSMAMDICTVKKGLKGMVNVDFTGRFKGELNVDNKKVTGLKLDMPSNKNKIFDIYSKLEEIQ